MNLCLCTANSRICNLRIVCEFTFANTVIDYDNLRFQTIQMQTVAVSMSTTPLQPFPYSILKIHENSINPVSS